MRAIALLLLCVNGLAAADDDPDPIAVLMRLRDRVLEHGERIPNHTCVETVVRDSYADTSGLGTKSCDTILSRRRLPSFSNLMRLATTDRLRLDVAFAGDREINSWAGASKFEEGEIDTLIPEGAMGTGSFASFLLSVFVGRAPRFVFERDIPGAGQTLLEYSFRVPREESHYSHKAHKEWVTTGYTGTLLVDSQTADLIRLTVRTDELPPETDSCEVDTTMEYSKVRLTGGDFILPKSSRQRFIARDGSEAENSYTYSNCHDFQAESNIRFDESHPNGGAHPTGAATPKWPGGLPVTIDTVTPIDSDRAAAGDRIEGRLVSAIRMADQTVVAPEGARAAGRLMRVEVRHAPNPEVTIALRWETVEIDGNPVPLALMPDRQLNPSTRGTKADGLPGLKNRGMEFELPRFSEVRYGVFHFPVEHRVVDTGLRTKWFTASF